MEPVKANEDTMLSAEKGLFYEKFDTIYMVITKQKSRAENTKHKKEETEKYRKPPN